jgi:pimeloyl-ACP methyl ester carboxylesterase
MIVKLVGKLFKWLFFGVALVLIVGAVGGRVYQMRSEAADLARFPPPGKMVNVGGHRMHIHCQGQGSPTVVVEQGLQGVSSAWKEITQSIAQTTRVCAYDRVGLGYSEPIDHPTRSTEVAEILHKLLGAAGVEDDLVLVGWSAGGVYVREYRRLHPEKVRAMLLVDSSHEQQQTRLPQPPARGGINTLEIAQYLAPIGVVRLSGIVKQQIERSPAPDKLKPELIALYHQSHVIQTMVRESESFTLDTRATQPPASLGDLPLIVLTPGKRAEPTGPGITPGYVQEERRVWGELQQELAAVSTRSKHVVATEGGHGIQYDQPELLVGSVSELVQMVRDGRAATQP